MLEKPLVRVVMKELTESLKKTVLDWILYIQAKRWEGKVSSPEIQKFAGALQGKRAKKGIFITSSSFSRQAREYVEKIDNKIVLIDGEQLTQFMIDHNIGVTPFALYEIKKIDSDYFSEE